MKELTREEADKICQDFANKHELIYKREGEVGFGRECCGFLATNGSYVDYSPTKAVYAESAINPHNFVDVPEFARENLTPPDDEVPNAYHKHECLAVLASEEAGGHHAQLARWVLYMESIAKNTNGELFVDRYDNGYRGMQAMMNQGYGYAIGVR